MKKILITLILTFQISFSFSQDYTIDVTAKSKNDYKISGEDLNGKIEYIHDDSETLLDSLKYVVKSLKICSYISKSSTFLKITLIMKKIFY